MQEMNFPVFPNQGGAEDYTGMGFQSLDLNAFPADPWHLFVRA
jgi:hypothetical protein